MPGDEPRFLSRPVRCLSNMPTTWSRENWIRAIYIFFFLWRNNPTLARTASLLRFIDHTQLDTHTHAHTQLDTHTKLDAHTHTRLDTHTIRHTYTHTIIHAHN
jgi:hypothetical protein